MKDGNPKAIFLQDYQEPEYYTSETFLDFDLADGVTEVTARLQVARAAGVAEDTPLRLDGDELELISVAVNGTALSANQYQRDDRSLTLFGLPETAELTLVTRVYPEQNTALEGLYRSGGMYCTQCEAEGFRRITYYQDRPDVLSRFTTTISADAGRYPVLLSNGNLLADETLADGRRRVTWQDPFPKPSYLFALVAGNLALLEDRFVTASGRDVQLRIYSEPHNIAKCDYAMGALKRAMAWDEVTFGREYDLDIFMIVAVEDFNMGAMENKGLNIFNTAAVLATRDMATDAAYQRVEAIVAHEYFHNWSGNRVTCRDWFQLSLKEGFTVFRDAEFSADMHARAVKRIEDVTGLRSVQFAEDAGPLAHPVRPASYIEISNFYTPTVYDKGAEVVAMLQRILGPALFRQGSDLYFQRHDGCAVTTEDFVRAMADVSGRDLGQFQRWYEQAGTPVVSVRDASQDGRLILRFAQHCPATPGQRDKAPFHIPVLLGLLDDQGRELVSEDLEVSCVDPVEVRRDPATGAPSLLVHLRSVATELSVGGLAATPAVSFLRGFSAPVRVDYPRDTAELEFLVEHDSDGFARWDALQTLILGAIRHLLDGAGPADGPSEGLIALFGALLQRALACPDEAEPLALLATMLTLPDENYLFEQLETVDVQAVCDARDDLQIAIASAHRDGWRALYEANAPRRQFVAEPLDMARRRLKHAALAFLVSGADREIVESILADHYHSADNLTDRRGALVQVTRLSQVSEGFRAHVLEDFYEHWRHESLVVNMWFALQAASPLADASRLRALASHPAFDARNPNKLRALYGSFGGQNHRNFHRLDGSGYRFLADAVIALDASNPQVAARLATPLTRWRRYDAARQRLMRHALERIAAAEQLSPDLFEVATKSLAADEAR